MVCIARIMVYARENTIFFHFGDFNELAAWISKRIKKELAPKKTRKSTEFSATLCDERFINFHIIKRRGIAPVTLSDIQYSVGAVVRWFLFPFAVRLVSWSSPNLTWAHAISNSNSMKFWWSLPFWLRLGFCFILLKCLWRLAPDSNFGWNTKHKVFFRRTEKSAALFVLPCLHILP